MRSPARTRQPLASRRKFVYPVDFKDIRGQETRQARLRDRLRRQPQRPLGRPARQRQDSDGARPAVDPARRDPARIARDHPHLFGCRRAKRRRPADPRPPLSRPASHDQPRRYGRRRTRAPSRRNQLGTPRHPLPRRVAGVRVQEPGEPPPAAGRQGRDHQPRGRHALVPRQFHVRRRHEPLPLRLFRR